MRGKQGLDLFAGPEPTPEFAVMVAEETGRLLELLESDALRQVARLKMEGFAVDEIAKQMSCSPRSVKRKLALIRDVWSSRM